MFIEPLERRELLAATFSTNSVKRLYSEVIGGAESGSRVVRYKNVTAKSLTIPANGVTIGGGNSSEYRIINSFTLPRGLKPGASIKVSIVFDPPTGETAGIKTGLLTVLATNGQSKSVRLRGLATTGIGGANEPSLQRIFDLYQMPIRTGDSNPSDSLLDLPPVAPNDELDIQTFKKAGAGNVTVFPIASYIQVVNPSLRFGHYTPGDANAKTELFTLADTDAQTVNPNATGSISFDPGSSAFGLYATYPGLGHSSFTEPALNTWETVGGNRQKAKVYPLINKGQPATPNAYVVVFEDLNTAEDFQDGVFIIQNVVKAS